MSVKPLLEETAMENYNTIESPLNRKGKSLNNSTEIPELPEKEEEKSKLKEGEEKKSNEPPPVSFFSLFRFSSRLDKVLMGIGIVISVIVGALTPGTIFLFGRIIDMFVENENVNSSVVPDNFTTAAGKKLVIGEINSSDDFLKRSSWVCSQMAIIALCVLFCHYIMVSFFSIAAANQTFKIRCLFMKSILRQDIGWYDTNQTGDFASRMTADLSRIQDGIGEKVCICVSILTQMVLGIVFAVIMSSELTLVFWCALLVIPISQAVIAKVQTTVFGDELATYALAGAVAEEVLSSIRTVVAFGGEKKEVERYDKHLRVAEKKGIQRGILTAAGSSLMCICFYGAYALGFWYGVKLILEEPENYKPSTLVIVFFCVVTCYFSVCQTTPYFEAFNLAKGAAAKVFSIIERVPTIDSSSDEGIVLSTLQGNITFNDVYFNYPARPDVPILRGLSLEIKTGETVALVGRSGCGKSTVVQLIQRFYDTLQGEILIDDNRIVDLNVGWLRDHMGVVGQEPVLFSGTIAENIRYGNIDATDEEIQEAAKAANVHDFITTLPQQYDTVVGERGAQLSGGQKQRVAIARALIRNPKILLLDEATSALDTESESIVQAALDKASEGRTTVIVAHRLSTIRAADKIAVVSAGSIKEIGIHDELMERKGIYFDLVTTQVGPEAKEDDEIEEEEEDDVGEIDEHRKSILHRQKSVVTACSYNSDETSPSRGRGRAMSSAKESILVKQSNEDEVRNVPKFRLMKMCLPEWPYITVGGILALGMGLITSIYAIIVGEILTLLSKDIDRIVADISYYSLLFVAMAFGFGIALFLQSFMFSVAGERLTSRLRKLSFISIVSQDMSWFDLPQNSIETLCSRLSSDASSVQGATGSRIPTVLQALSTLVCAVIMGMVYNQKLGAVVLSFIPLILTATYFESKTERGNVLGEKSAAEEASRVAIEAIDSIRTVASLHREDAFYRRFKASLIAALNNTRRYSHIRGVTFGFAQSIPKFAYATSFYYGVLLVYRKEVAYGNIFKVMETILVGTSAVCQSVVFAPDYQKAKIGAARIFELLNLRTKVDASLQEGIVLDYAKGDIEFRDVCFSYPSRPKVKILRGLSLDIKPGETVALVGSSGCGKSTCIQLIQRFYESSSGEVLLDNTDVKALKVSFLRSKLGIVFQEPTLFSYSLAENIAYGDNSRQVPMDEIITAARQANIHSFISTLPEGYSTHVGDKGTQLSGGQKQRIAIARALVRNPKILLLDEATSALDAESEKVVQEALEIASSGRTCITIAHRLTTIQNADKIAVIHRGRVVEKGTHHELLAKRGRYYNLHTVQCSAK